MKNKCLLVLLLALGCCHVQAQKSQKNPLPEALVQLNQKEFIQIALPDSRNKKVSPHWNFHRYKSETDSRKHGICTVSHSLWRNSLHDTCNG